MEYKILIEFIPKLRVWGSFECFLNNLLKKTSFPIQGEPFDFTLKITNIDDSVFPGATIKGIKISPAQTAGRSIFHKIPKEFSVSSLNPNESKEIQIGKLTTLLEGLTWIECLVSPVQ